MTQVPLYDWLYADGTGFGCGTEREVLYWQGEGVVEPDAKLGEVLGYEDARADEKRAMLWAKAA